ncbi:unnamed protein product [Angiostrongylus costaricensis]|uniref:CLASP_N domain-containing protein n=1 Tax=Angiostrongylus costaricensis TaxID=334426 RepID=A0A158PGQ9_ANGCS|nr:unnamed protein product [Angiostrongylus costaricensis]
MDAVLFAVNSPQLDSKCYAVEILLLLLDKPQGFVVLMRALTVMTAKSRDYIRLTLFVSQLKHGLHTQKLHIQILIVRLFNKLLATAPSSLHRSLIRSEIILARFSAEYVENLITTQSTPFGGMDILANELDLWRSLGSSTIASYSFEQSHIYGKKFQASTTVTKNVERHRFKKQSGATFGERSSAAGHYPEVDRNTSNAFYPDRRSLTLSNRAWQGLDRSPPRAHYTNPTSPRTRFAEPVIVEAQIPHVGFSYLFPSQPVVASFVSKRTVTPDHHHRQVSFEHLTSIFSCYGRNDEAFYATDSRTSSRAKVLSPSINGDDVRDALSQFDYLNDYENSSLRERGREASYHF